MPTGHRREAQVQLYPYSTPAPEVSERPAPRPGRFIPNKESRYPFYRRLRGPRAGVDNSEISHAHRGSNPGRSSP
jgi:hypothetical protein